MQDAEVIEMVNVKEITRETLPELAKGQGHKYDHGHAVVVTGGPSKTGAARLAARAALRVGAGVVTLACPLRAVPEIAAQVTAVMLHPMDGPSGLGELMEDARLNALCLGPGLGLTQSTADLVRVALALGRPCVLDADALSRFTRAPEALFDQVHDEVVLTPHFGEFKRIFPDLADRMSTETRAHYVSEAARRAGCTVLLKGPETLIGTSDGRVARHAALNDRAVPWLATAGAGDVLTGLITGLVARGLDPFDAACAATWLHVEAARHVGAGLIAEDLPDAIPSVFRDLFA